MCVLYAVVQMHGAREREIEPFATFIEKSFKLNKLCVYYMWWFKCTERERDKEMELSYMSVPIICPT
jgi:hypothetical protein